MPKRKPTPNVLREFERKQLADLALLGPARCHSGRP
jgi:hypothetical protein